MDDQRFDDLVATGDDFIEHYGRLGMKWYQHIFGEEQGHAKYANKSEAKNKALAAKQGKFENSGNSAKKKSKKQLKEEAEAERYKKDAKAAYDEDVKKLNDRADRISMISGAAGGILGGVPVAVAAGVKANKKAAKLREKYGLNAEGYSKEDLKKGRVDADKYVSEVENYNKEFKKAQSKLSFNPNKHLQKGVDSVNKANEHLKRLDESLGYDRKYAAAKEKMIRAENNYRNSNEYYKEDQTAKGTSGKETKTLKRLSDAYESAKKAYTKEAERVVRDTIKSSYDDVKKKDKAAISKGQRIVDALVSKNDGASYSQEYGKTLKSESSRNTRIKSSHNTLEKYFKQQASKGTSRQEAINSMPKNVREAYNVANYYDEDGAWYVLDKAYRSK